MGEKIAPAPWEFWRDSDREIDERTDGSPRDFIVGGNVRRASPEEAPSRWATVCEAVPNEATARLIAAAPELLAALKEAREELVLAARSSARATTTATCDRPRRGLLAAVRPLRDAVRKAEGR
jgi:hypothetical protein